MVKGKDEPIRIYEPMCLETEASEALLADVNTYHRAYNCYLEQRWDEAQQLFEQLQKQEPDSHLYSLYLERISTMRAEPPPENWDGAYRFTTK